MVDNKMLSRLVSFGFSEYEAKAYAALVGTHPVTAYELAHLASVPTSKIYGALSRLEEQGLVSQLEEGGKKRYLPLDPGEFIARRRSRMTADLDALEHELAALRQEPDLSYVWNIDKLPWFCDKAARMIEGAGATILLSLWGEEFSRFFPLLQAAEARGVALCIVHFGPVEQSCGQLYAHPIERTLYEERGGRGFTLVVDSRETLLATLYPGDRVEGAWSLTPGLVTVAEDYIKHDVYVMKIVRRFDGLLIERFGAGYKKLRDVFRDEEVR